MNNTKSHVSAALQSIVRQAILEAEKLRDFFEYINKSFF